MIDAVILEGIDVASFELAKQAQDYFNAWRAGLVYIPRAALRAMGRRYLRLRDAEDLNMQDVFEFGRLYAFFCLMYPPDGEIMTAGAIAIDFSNLLLLRDETPSPTDISV